MILVCAGMMSGNHTGACKFMLLSLSIHNIAICCKSRMSLYSVKTTYQCMLSGHDVSEFFKSKMSVYDVSASCQCMLSGYGASLCFQRMMSVHRVSVCCQEINLHYAVKASYGVRT